MLRALLSYPSVAIKFLWLAPIFFLASGSGHLSACTDFLPNSLLGVSSFRCIRWQMKFREITSSLANILWLNNDVAFIFVLVFSHGK